MVCFELLVLWGLQALLHLLSLVCVLVWLVAARCWLGPLSVGAGVKNN